MEIIKELCAYLPRKNPRGVWGEFGMRDYLSISNWTIREKVINEETGYVDFWVESFRLGMPGKFQVRTNWEETAVVGVYWATEGLDDPVLRKKAASLFDLTFTENMADQLKNRSVIDHPDAGSW